MNGRCDTKANCYFCFRDEKPRTDEEKIHFLFDALVHAQHDLDGKDNALYRFAADKLMITLPPVMTPHLIYKMIEERIPTPWAYDQVCKANEAKRKRIEELEACLYRDKAQRKGM